MVAARAAADPFHSLLCANVNGKGNDSQAVGGHFGARHQLCLKIMLS